MISFSIVRVCEAAVDIGGKYGVRGKFPTLGSLVSVLVNNAYYFAGFLILVLLIFAGINIIIGAGSQDSGKMEKGKNAATAAVAGFLVVVLSWFIIRLIEAITGAEIFNSGL